MVTEREVGQYTPLPHDALVALPVVVADAELPETVPPVKELFPIAMEIPPPYADAVAPAVASLVATALFAYTSPPVIFIFALPYMPPPDAVAEDAVDVELFALAVQVLL